MIYIKSLSLLLLCAVMGAEVFAADVRDSFNELAKQCAPDVAADTLRALVKTESSFNPYAIGVVGGKGLHPKNLQEAVFFVSELVAAKRNFSVGLGQINQANFKTLGVTAEQLFEPCTNLKAAAKILGSCYLRMSDKGQGEAKALADALSCYYSGNDTTGYKHGYVSRVKQNAALPKDLKVPSISILNKAQTSSSDNKMKSAASSELLVSPKVMTDSSSKQKGGTEHSKLIF